MKLGKVFYIETSAGFGFLQFVGVTSWGSQIIRVLEPVKSEPHISQEEVDLPERYTVGFALNAAVRRKIIGNVGQFAIPINYKLPKKARTQHNIRGEFLGWHIVDQTTLNRELRQTLSDEELQLSPHGSPNDTLLKEWLESDWRLNSWR